MASVTTGANTMVKPIPLSCTSTCWAVLSIPLPNVVAKSPPPPHDLAKWLRTLHELSQSGDRERLLGAIQVLVPTYRRTPGQPLVPEVRIPRPEEATSGVSLRRGPLPAYEDLELPFS